MKYGYARVSTARQFKNGNTIEDQMAALRENGAEEIIVDHHTGTKMDRPNLNDLLNRLQAGDTLIVTKLDRFARTATEGNAIVKDLHERGVNIHILNMGMADNTPMGKLVVTMLLAFAEFERDMIVERTQSGKAIARANGKRVDGRPKKFSRTQIDHAMELLQSGNSFTQVEKMTGISVSTLKRAKREIVASQL